MLERLELIGFKSFAERTRFDFARGVTAVVGPNGSGKSNIVDAVRWLLGEQSAKNLRGGEMTDVIFNGSSSRRSLGMAEVSMQFDNTSRILGLDEDRVEVTRRVYRDGEGEYQVNGRPARLKDVKDLFLGSGAGHGAYSVIEQGRVDALLSASTKDRRLIFEEAAGISRFKARKQEAARKLERVDGDLVRVRDILSELDKQLRTLRLQASKAERYLAHTGRLRELRVGLGRQEFRRLGVGLRAEEAALAALRAELGGAGERSAGREAELAALAQELAALAASLRRTEQLIAQSRAQIAASEAAARSERGQCETLDDELLRLGKQRAGLQTRLRLLDVERSRLAESLAAAQSDLDRGGAASAQAEEAARRASAEIAELDSETQADRDAQFDAVSRSARHHGDAGTARQQAERFGRELERKQAEAAGLASRHLALDTALAELGQTGAGVQQKLIQARQSRDDRAAARDRLRRDADALQGELEARRDERSASQGRSEVLEQLERSLEGLGAGVRAVVGRLATGDPELAPHLFGMVADLLSVPHEFAPVIDLALGDTAERFVVRGEAGLAAALAALGPLPGRVGLVPCAGPAPAAPALALVGPESEADGVVCAAELARCDAPELERLPQQLLGRLWIVPDLPAARRLAGRYPGHRFVTRAGEFVEPDGAVEVGPTDGAFGVLSRKAELRELRSRVRELERAIARLESAQADLRRRADEHEAPLRALEAEIAALSGAAGTLRDQILEQRQVQRQLADQHETLRLEAAHLAADRTKAEAAHRAASDGARTADAEVEAIRARLAGREAARKAAEAERESLQQASLAAQVELGRLRELANGLRQRRDSLETEWKQRRFDGVNLAQSERSARLRLTESQLTILRATQEVAGAILENERLERHAAEASVRHADTEAKRKELDAGLRTERDATQARRDAAHGRELAAESLRNRREAVARRIREDFSEELADDPAPDEAPPPADAAEAEAEIAELKKKVEKLGSVNLEAVAELAEQEKREGELRGQHDDLADARAKLQAIIDQVNADSRRLFTETLTAVRGHFQELFRKLFAGGMADIVLEDEADVLESGIEITARPPGKQLQKISLLSGGEKALTAVALLLAIFQSRPSPFCLLDEVDAAMDEANTHRLAQALREFADRTQFIVITHKKRTMAAADALYGVTMQESGVSRLVGVKFEDWPEDAAEAA